jgi:poly-beta-1,6-N-acetyl-D-glucosamine synthase
MKTRPYAPYAPHNPADTEEFPRCETTEEFPRLTFPTEPTDITITLPRFTDTTTAHIGRVIVLVPARNEGDCIAATVSAVYAQQHAPDRVIVVINNATDDGETEREAKAAGAEVIDAGVCKYHKAQALNHALAQILPGLTDDDYVLIQDADTQLNETFIGNALAAYGRRVGGVCARYDTHEPKGLLQWLQANEFTRSRRKTTRDKGQARILVGIAALFNVKVIRHVIQARTDGTLSGSPTFYNEGSSCEDYRLTLDLKALGYKLVCPSTCRPRTHAMPNFEKLWGQRVRWTRGALDDLRDLGYNKVTRRYFWAQWGRLFALLSPLIYVSYLVSLEVEYHTIVWQLFWLWVNALTITERLITVRKGGWRAMLLAALILPELAYDWYLAAAYFTGIYEHLRAKPAPWKET